MISYLTLIQALKASPDGITFKNAPTEVFKKIVALASAGCIDVTFPSQTERITIATVVKKTPTPVIERVQVSFWRDGARKGMYSQQAYKVTGTPREGFITVELMNGKPYTVAVKHTKAVA